jgi:hypothetical protein
MNIFVFFLNGAHIYDLYSNVAIKITHVKFHIKLKIIVIKNNKEHSVCYCNNDKYESVITGKADSDCRRLFVTSRQINEHFL